MPQTAIFEYITFLTHEARSYQCHLYPLQVANCCPNSRLVVGLGDLKWLINEKQIIIKAVP